MYNINSKVKQKHKYTEEKEAANRNQLYINVMIYIETLKFTTYTCIQYTSINIMTVCNVVSRWLQFL